MAPMAPPPKRRSPLRNAIDPGTNETDKNRPREGRWPERKPAFTKRRHRTTQAPRSAVRGVPGGPRSRRAASPGHLPSKANGCEQCWRPVGSGPTGCLDPRTRHEGPWPAGGHGGAGSRPRESMQTAVCKRPPGVRGRTPERGYAAGSRPGGCTQRRSRRLGGLLPQHGHCRPRCLN